MGGSIAPSASLPAVDPPVGHKYGVRRVSGCERLRGVYPRRVRDRARALQQKREARFKAAKYDLQASQERLLRRAHVDPAAYLEVAVAYACAF